MIAAAADGPALTSAATCRATKEALQVQGTGPAAWKQIGLRLKPVAGHASADLKSTLIVFQAYFEKGGDGTPEAELAEFRKTEMWLTANDKLRDICGS